MDIKGFKDRDGVVHKYDHNSLANIPENSMVTDEQIAVAVEKYLTENPIEGVTDQQVRDAVATYLTENPVEGVTDEQIAQAVNDYLVKNPPASGDPGKDGGYYTPGVTQLDDETIQFDFAPSKEDMPTVKPVQVALPIPDSSVTIDDTLTVEGAAADAKAVGDALGKKLDKSGGTMSGKIVFPTGDQNVGFANGEDMKIFGYGTYNGAMHMRVGDTTYPFQIRGEGAKPKYNDSEIALVGDIPTDDHINSLINTALGVIENGTY